MHMCDIVLKHTNYNYIVHRSNGTTTCYYNHNEYDFNKLMSDMEYILCYRKLILNMKIKNPKIDVSYEYTYKPIHFSHKWTIYDDTELVELFQKHLESTGMTLISFSKEHDIELSKLHQFINYHSIMNITSIRICLVKYMISSGYSQYQKYIDVKDHKNIYYFGTYY